MKKVCQEWKLLGACLLLGLATPGVAAAQILGEEEVCLRFDSLYFGTNAWWDEDVDRVGTDTLRLGLELISAELGVSDTTRVATSSFRPDAFRDSYWYAPTRDSLVILWKSRSISTLFRLERDGDSLSGHHYWTSDTGPFELIPMPTTAWWVECVGSDT